MRDILAVSPLQSGLEINDVDSQLGTGGIRSVVPEKLRFHIDWCERGDSNPHGFTRQILSLVRLPIPPLSQRVPQKIVSHLPLCLTLPLAFSIIATLYAVPPIYVRILLPLLAYE